MQRPSCTCSNDLGAAAACHATLFARFDRNGTWLSRTHCVSPLFTSNATTTEVTAMSLRPNWKAPPITTGWKYSLAMMLLLITGLGCAFWLSRPAAGAKQGRINGQEI